MSDDQTPTDDEQPEQLDITTATEDQLRGHYDTLSAQIAELEAQPRTLDSVSALAELKAERNTVVTAVNQLIEMDAAPMEDAVFVTAEVPAPEEAEVPVPDEASEVPVPDDASELVDAAEAVLAGAVVASVDDRPVAPAAYTRPRVAYTAGAGQTVYSQGVEMTTEQLARAWESRRTNLRPGATGEATRAVVANLPGFDETPDLPVEMLTRDNSRSRNDALIAESVQMWRDKRAGVPAAMTAAICDPLDIIRDIPFGGEVDTPFAGSFPSRPVGRLGYQFTRASSLSVAASGVTLWTEEDQEGIDPDDSSTWKPTVLIECAEPAEVRAEELVTSATVDNSTEMSSPERVAEFMHKLAVARARRREQYLLGLFDATASDYTLTGTYGAMTTLIQAVHTLLPQLLYPERLSETDYDLVIDPGYFNKLVIDENTKCEVSAEDVAAKVRREVGLNLVILRDFVGSNPFQTPATPGGGATALTALPSTNRVRLVPGAAYIYGATGEESTGWQTDPQLARQNRMQAFSAEWLMLAKHGEHPAAYIDITSDSNGARGGCIVPE